MKRKLMKVGLKESSSKALNIATILREREGNKLFEYEEVDMHNPVVGRSRLLKLNLVRFSRE